MYRRSILVEYNHAKEINVDDVISAWNVDIYSWMGFQLSFYRMEIELKIEMVLYSLIAFDERVTFWFQGTWSLPCACAYVALFVCEARV